MPARTLLYQFLSNHTPNLSRRETIILEGLICDLVCQELKAFFRVQFVHWFRLLKLSQEEEKIMLDTSFIKLIIEDTVATDTYDLDGIARYTHHDREVIEDVVLGRNTSPSAELLQRLMDLHRSARPDLYAEIQRKITAKLMEE